MAALKTLDNLPACGLRSSLPPTFSCPEPGLGFLVPAFHGGFFKEVPKRKRLGAHDSVPYCPAFSGPSGHHQLWLSLQTLFLVSFCRTGDVSVCVWGALSMGTLLNHSTAGGKEQMLGTPSYKGEPGIHWVITHLSTGSSVFVLKPIKCTEPEKPKPQL